jgi:hypothetical protein
MRNRKFYMIAATSILGLSFNDSSAMEGNQQPNEHMDCTYLQTVRGADNEGFIQGLIANGMVEVDGMEYSLTPDQVKKLKEKVPGMSKYKGQTRPLSWFAKRGEAPSHANPMTFTCTYQLGISSPRGAADTVLGRKDDEFGARPVRSQTEVFDFTVTNKKLKDVGDQALMLQRGIAGHAEKYGE